MTFNRNKFQKEGGQVFGLDINACSKHIYTGTQTRGTRTLVLCLTTAVRMTLIHFSQMLLDIKFETKALNDPKMTLKTIIATSPSYMDHNFSRSPRFQSVLLYGQPFYVTDHVGTCAPNDSKWPWTLSGQRYPMYVLLELTIPTFHSVALYG